jgi:hypothetical protein
MASHENHFGEGFFYWLVLSASFLWSKFSGLIDRVAENIPDQLTLPVHEVQLLPQLADLIPALIITSCCAVFSLMVTSTIKWIFFKIFPSLKK